jgi:hypothetical protein
LEELTSVIKIANPIAKSDMSEWQSFMSNQSSTWPSPMLKQSWDLANNLPAFFFLGIVSRSAGIDSVFLI